MKIYVNGELAQDNRIYLPSEDEEEKKPLTNVYSTEETVVGTWIDGRPVYEKTVIGTAPTSKSSWGLVAGSHVPNLDILISCSGFVLSTQKTWIPFESTDTNVKSQFLYARDDTTNSGFYKGVNLMLTGVGYDTMAGQPVVVVMRYVKSDEISASMNFEVPANQTAVTASYDPY